MISGVDAVLSGARRWHVEQGHVLDVLRRLPDGCAQCVVTSPPYWGLRDYGLAPVEWGDGWRGALGLEPTPDLYVAHMVEVFLEVRRVLRPGGTLWLNLGDCYATGAGKVGDCPGGGEQGARWRGEGSKHDGPKGPAVGPATQPNRLPIVGLKPKDLVGIPWRIAFALQADGWWLRSDIIWSKPNPMPESVGDRPTKAHEYLFLLSKSERYYYDANAVRESEARQWTGQRNWQRWTSGLADGIVLGRDTDPNCGLVGSGSTDGRRNRRSVWTIPTSPFPEAHFAVMPAALVAPCIKAGTSERGCCARCGAAWERLTSHEAGDTEARDRPKRTAGMDSSTSTLGLSGNGSKEWAARGGKTHTLGWHPTCDCVGEVAPCLVLDPFNGAGTVGLVATRLGRRYLGIDLSDTYVGMARRRIEEDAPLFNRAVVEASR